jgi:hypothetical protein
METKQKPQRKPAIANKPILKWQPSHYVTIEEFAEQHNVTARTVYQWRSKHPDKMAFYQICTEDGGRGERVYVRRNQVVTEQMRKVGRPKKK